MVVTPGSSYGRYGEGYIRLSLTTPDEQVEKGCQRIEGLDDTGPAGRLAPSPRTEDEEEQQTLPGNRPDQPAWLT